MSHSSTAERLKRLRELAGLSQFALAAKTRIDRAILSAIENGHVTPKPEQVSAIEQACKAGVDDAMEQMRKRSQEVYMELALSA